VVIAAAGFRTIGRSLGPGLVAGTRAGHEGKRRRYSAASLATAISTGFTLRAFSAMRADLPLRPRR